MSQYSYAAQNGGFLPQSESTVLVAAGSNQFSDEGSPTETLVAGLRLLRERGAVIRAISAYYATPCFPAGAGPDYVNAAFRMDLAGDARAALTLLHEVEADLGRRRVARWGQRTLDLDLIACGQQILPDAGTLRHWIDLPLERQMREAPEDLILPHPRIQERAFVLGPLMDVAPQWVHPLLGQTVRQMYAALPEGDRNAVKPLVFRPEDQ